MVRQQHRRDNLLVQQILACTHLQELARIVLPFASVVIEVLFPIASTPPFDLTTLRKFESVDDLTRYHIHHLLVKARVGFTWTQTTSDDH